MKKELFQKIKTVVGDLLDNYEKYTDKKAQHKDLFQKLSDLKTILEKYNIETKLRWNISLPTTNASMKCLTAFIKKNLSVLILRPYSKIYYQDSVAAK